VHLPDHRNESIPDSYSTSLVFDYSDSPIFPSTLLKISPALRCAPRATECDSVPDSNSVFDFFRQPFLIPSPLPTEILKYRRTLLIAAPPEPPSASRSATAAHPRMSLTSPGSFSILSALLPTILKHLAEPMFIGAPFGTPNVSISPTAPQPCLSAWRRKHSSIASQRQDFDLRRH
jgi:hypothetical protein